MHRILELFCGIGGMHYSLKESLCDFTIAAAVDINTVTNSVYKHNFPDVQLMQREIQSMDVMELESLDFDVILMSPPCQPFTRVGLKKDSEDPRTNAFLCLLSNISMMSIPPKYIFVENVKGFEDSKTRNELISFLTKTGYDYQEFMLSPLQFGIPNSRLRYYCMAKLKSAGGFMFTTTPSVLFKIPGEALPFLLNTHPFMSDLELNNSNEPEELTQTLDGNPHISKLYQYLESLDSSLLTDYELTSDQLKYYQGLDIRSPGSRNTCCFTKRYGSYFVGSGSFLAHETDQSKGLRFFTPREIANLMHFPVDFGFPPGLSRKQQYRALGNSLNVYVVGCLLKLMMT